MDYLNYRESIKLRNKKEKRERTKSPKKRKRDLQRSIDLFIGIYDIIYTFSHHRYHRLERFTTLLNLTSVY